VGFAYIDTSCLVAVAFGEPEATEVERGLEALERIFSSYLLEAELLASLAREGVDTGVPFLSAVAWVLPDRSLGPEIRRVLEHGYVRGADLWHLATALFLADDPEALPFFTLDKRQREVAGALGFPTP
jgi:predicted nucleic acid-binding protein